MLSLSKRKSFITTLVLLLVALAGYFVFREKTVPVTYRTEPVANGDVTVKVTASGTLSALVTVEIGSQVSGRIQAIHADFNTPVRKGQLIAKIDPLLFDAAIRQAAANRTAALGSLERAKAQALEASRQFERYQKLDGKNLIAESERDTAESAYLAAKAQIKSAEGGLAQADAALHQARVNLQYTDIYSPIDGIVISRDVDTGQTVAASLQAPVLFVIAEDLAKMQVDTSVAESDIGKIRNGMTAVFTVDAYPGERFTGKVRQVRNAPQNVQNVVTYNAVIDVENPEQKLKPGMTANVAFTVAEHKNVLRVPNAALRYRPAVTKPDGATERKRDKGVWILQNGVPVEKPVETGLTDGSFTQVITGVSAGEEVIIGETTTGGPEPQRRNSLRF